MCKQKVFPKDIPDISSMIETNTSHTDIAKKYDVAQETMSAFIRANNLAKPHDPNMRAYTPRQAYYSDICDGSTRFILRRPGCKDMAVIPMDEYLQLKAASNGQ